MIDQPGLFDDDDGKPPFWFDGETYNDDDDGPRLNRQIGRVFSCMGDGTWRTLDEIGAATGDPPASISARLRDLRKKRFGEHIVERRHRGHPGDGLYEYRLTVMGRLGA